MSWKGKKWRWICIKRDSDDFDDKNIVWGVENMIKFYDVLKPELDKYFKEEKEITLQRIVS